MSACVYTLADPRTDNVRYVGFSRNLYKRKYAHYRDDDGTHKSNWVQALRRQGLRPKVEILEELENPSESQASECERFWIESLRQMGATLTNSKLATAVRFTMTDEIKQKISHKHKGKIISQEARARMSAAAKNRPPEVRENMAAARRGKSLSLETRRKLSLAHAGRKMSSEAIANGILARTGLKRTPEFCKRMSDMKRGLKQSAETIRKRADAHRGKKHSEAARLKMSAAKRGHPVSAATRQKLSDAIKLKWANGAYAERNNHATSQTQNSQGQHAQSAV